MWNSLWNDTAALNRIAGALALIAIATISIVLVRKLASLPEFAIRHVVVTGANGKLAHADPAHIAAVVQHELRGTFFTIDLSTARDALQRVSWVRRVAVRREWPARIEIAIEEHEPLARWNDISLVNRQGEVFDAEYGDDLPTFHAPEGTSAEVTARYREFASLLDRSGDAIESITRSARGAWGVKLDDGLDVALGREQVSERWARWIQVGERYRSRIARGRELVAIDMRYPNGFAARVNGDWPREPVSKAQGAKATTAKATPATQATQATQSTQSTQSTQGSRATAMHAAAKATQPTKVGTTQPAKVSAESRRIQAIKETGHRG